MRTQGLEGCHVAGNSTGGGVALELAARGAVASAVGSGADRFLERARARFLPGIGEEHRVRSPGCLRPVAPALLRLAPLRALFFAQYSHTRSGISPQDALGDVDAIIGACSFDDVCAAFTGYLAPTKRGRPGPVTIAWGAKDRLLLPRQRDRARRRLPRARHLLIAGAGHLMMRDDPQKVADLIRSGTHRY